MNRLNSLSVVVPERENALMSNLNFSLIIFFERAQRYNLPRSGVLLCLVTPQGVLASSRTDTGRQ